MVDVDTDGYADEDRALFVSVGDDSVRPTAYARGPWSLDWLHGGPVAALLAHAVESIREDGVNWRMKRWAPETSRALINWMYRKQLWKFAPV